MPEYRRARTEGATYFFTVVTYRRQPILCLDKSRQILRDVISQVQRSHPFRVDAWVLLPDHIHCLWSLPEGDRNYSVRWALIKKEFTKRVRLVLGPEVDHHRSESRKRHGERTIWQRRFWEHQIRNEEDYTRHMDYVHYNPVKHGLAKSPKDWPHSTFHRYVAEGMYEADWGSVADIAWLKDIGSE